MIDATHLNIDHGYLFRRSFVRTYEVHYSFYFLLATLDGARSR